MATPIEDFLKAHEASPEYLGNVKRAALTAKSKKQKKPDLPAANMQAEQDGLDEIGTDNWIGRLMGR